MPVLVSCSRARGTITPTYLPLRTGVPANTGNSPNAVSMLAQRQRRWASIETVLDECLVFTGVVAQCWFGVVRALHTVSQH